MRSFLNRLRSNARQRTIRAEWDFQRANAMSPSHRAEIDAMFSRHL